MESEKLEVQFGESQAGCEGRAVRRGTKERWVGGREGGGKEERGAGEG